MDDNLKSENKHLKGHFSLKVFLIYSIIAIIICVVVFLFNYDAVYGNSNYFGGSFSVGVLCFLFSIAYLIVSVVLKAAFKDRIRIWPLILASFLIPVFCLNYCYRAFDKDGHLYPLVDKGGIFHFIVIGDFDFDGMSDDLEHILDDEREYSMRYGGHYDDTVIDYIETNSIGTGSGLSGCFCDYDWELRRINVHLGRDSVKLKQVKITVAFHDSAAAQEVSFDLGGSKLEHTLNKDNTVSIVFDAEVCLDLQNSLQSETDPIFIGYSFASDKPLKEYTESEIMDYFTVHTQREFTPIDCVLISDLDGYIGAVLFEPQDDDQVGVAYLKDDGAIFKVFAASILSEEPDFEYLGCGEVSFMTEPGDGYLHECYVIFTPPGDGKEHEFYVNWLKRQKAT